MVCKAPPARSQARILIIVAFKTSHSSPEVQLSAASLDVVCMILRSWVKILTFSNKAVLKIAKVGNEGFGMSGARFDRLITL